MVLGIKTPRRMWVEPGMIIDVDAIGDITGTDIEMYMDKGILVEGKTKKSAAKPKSVPPTKDRKTEVLSDGSTTVVQNANKNDGYKETPTVRGTVSKVHSGAAVIMAPEDTPESVNLQISEITKGESYEALPDDIKQKIAVVEKIAASDGNDKTAKKKAGRPKKVQAS
jgi:hypothetical protein